jgi:hypothetical protein
VLVFDLAATPLSVDGLVQLGQSACTSAPTNQRHSTKHADTPELYMI